MILYSRGYIPEREAIVLGIGLSESNLRLMMDENKPIFIRGEKFNLKSTNFVICAARDQDQFELRLLGWIEEHKIQAPNTIGAISLDDGKLFLLPMSGPKGKVWLVGLTQESYRCLRSKERLSFRVRMDREVGESIDVEFFWGPTQEIMEESMLFETKTQVRRY